MFEESTLRLDKSDVSLLQALSESANECPCLVQYSGDDTGKRHPLTKPLAVIGRAPQAEVYIESPDISRRHAELDVAGSSVVLRDLGSVNGTYLNGARVMAPAELQDGDLIRLGKVVLKFFTRTNIEALLHDSMYRSAAMDAGTDTFCKRYLLQVLEREVRLAHRSGRPLCLVCLDLDHFKAVNDRHGHNAGDLVLRGTAAAVQKELRHSDIFGRIGGEEFAVVLPDTSLRLARDLAERLRAVVEATVFELAIEDSLGNVSVQHRQTASFGVAQLGPDMPDARSLLGAADARLYAAKHAGRNRVSSSEPATAAPP
jgi:two-component system, cell cycle response regulator